VLGEEVFFISFIPFCCWNVSRQVAVHQTALLALSVGFGNILKNYIQSPRPPHKTVWLNSKNPQMDPGFPSTHTMTAFTIPWYLFLFYTDTMSLSNVCVSVAILLWWSFSIAISRLYNGHHYIVDVIGGFLLAISMLVGWTQYLRYYADPWLSNPGYYVPLATFAAIVLILYFHPQASSPNPATAETGLVCGTFFGTAFGVWLHHYMQLSTGLGIQFPNAMLFFPTNPILVIMLRFLIGAGFLLLAKDLTKRIFLPIFLYCNKIMNSISNNKKQKIDRSNYKQTGVETAVKLVTYSAVGLTATLTPHVCCMLGLFHVSDLVVFIY